RGLRLARARPARSRPARARPARARPARERWEPGLSSMLSSRFCQHDFRHGVVCWRVRQCGRSVAPGALGETSSMLNPESRAASDRSNEREPDVRDIIDYADGIGELARINGADWNLEIGVLAEIFAHSNPGRAPAVLFDQIKGYPAGMRIVSGLHNTCRRLA